MSVVVRRIRPTDGPTLKSIRLAALLDTPSAFGSSYALEVDRPAEEWDRRAERASAGRAGILCLAWNDDQAVGIVGAYRPVDSPNQVELISMWVAPEARGSGRARQLVGAVIAWASETAAESINLWVTEGNAPALRLYEAMGFETTGDAQPLPSDPDKTEIRMRLATSPR